MTEKDDHLHAASIERASEDQKGIKVASENHKLAVSHKGAKRGRWNSAGPKRSTLLGEPRQNMEGLY
ncbi:hypothetical protein BaRGS_00021129 [Batillaria attramentaria]|uniref:Uncharacterized protein n=1 Tax=Batillaria attramentaria TaxID=370345 RepID=A0ABD0KK70_9CAEN